MSSVVIRVVGRDDTTILDRVASDVFDQPVSARLTEEFLSDPRHHLAVALVDGEVVGMASAVHYVHPDKRPQLFINEVGVTPAHRGRGIARALLDELVRIGEELECTEAWVLTDRANLVAQRLYESAGAVRPPDQCIMYTIPISH
jgi:ribosomal protein S18 acetylase RimI-like enzyme